MLTMFHYTIWGKPLRDLGFRTLKESILRLSENVEMFQEVKEILRINKDKIDFIDKKVDTGFCCPLDLHCLYSRDEILAAIGYYKPDSMPSVREGVLYFREKNTDVFFVTLNKTEKDFSQSTMYDDYAIDEVLFHWQSQSTTSDASPTGQRYINHGNLGSKVMIFVREYKKDGDIAAPYKYLGTANYESYKGSRPMNIVWRLDNEMPGELVN